MTSQYFAKYLGFVIKFCYCIWSMREEKRGLILHFSFLLLFLHNFRDFSGVPLFQARSYNKQMRPAILDHCSGNKWTNTSHHPEFLVGEEVGNFSAPSSSSCFLEFIIFLAGPDTHTGSWDIRYSTLNIWNSQQILIILWP